MKVLLLCLCLLASHANGQETGYHRSYDWRPVEGIQSYSYQSQPVIPSPLEDPRLSSYQASPYAVGYQDNYGYGGSNSAFEEPYGYNVIRDRDFNITAEKYGGFGGSGDTKGFGAYDAPKDNRYEEAEPVKQEVSDVFSELLNIGSSRNRFFRRRPFHHRPLPPPL